MINKSICFVVMVLSLTLTACTFAVDSTLQPSEVNMTAPASGTSKTIFFPRQKKTEGERAVMEARTGGILVLENNCIRVDRETSTNASYLLIWPPDFNFSVENDTVRILNEDGKAVASIGDKVIISGGEVPVLYEPVKGQVPSQCNEPYWIIGDEISRVDTSKPYPAP
ncbi:MAG: hypothetical protein M5U05_00075 [Anaerolineales bacterium]|mgnify:CR=1 FL=1|nr:hypothetical protein [Anaerolineales bacterium]